MGGLCVCLHRTPYNDRLHKCFIWCWFVPSPVHAMAGNRCIPGCHARLIVKCRVFGLLSVHCCACAWFQRRYVNLIAMPSSRRLHTRQHKMVIQKRPSGGLLPTGSSHARVSACTRFEINPARVISRYSPVVAKRVTGVCDWPRCFPLVIPPKIHPVFNEVAVGLSVPRPHRRVAEIKVDVAAFAYIACVG